MNFFLSDFLSQNVLIHPSPKISQGAKYGNTTELYTTESEIKWAKKEKFYKWTHGKLKNSQQAYVVEK